MNDLSRRDLRMMGASGAALTVGSSLLVACGRQQAGGPDEPFELGALIPLTGIETWGSPCW